MLRVQDGGFCVFILLKYDVCSCCWLIKTFHWGSFRFNFITLFFMHSCLSERYGWLRYRNPVKTTSLGKIVIKSLVDKLTNRVSRNTAPAAPFAPAPKIGILTRAADVMALSGWPSGAEPVWGEPHSRGQLQWSGPFLPAHFLEGKLTELFTQFTRILCS